jgi:hypothetical protein
VDFYLSVNNLQRQSRKFLTVPLLSNPLGQEDNQKDEASTPKGEEGDS